MGSIAVIELRGVARRYAVGDTTVTALEGVNDSWMSRVLRMNFLSPRIVDAILSGTQPVTLTAAWLRRSDLPLDWEQQWETLAA